MPPHLQVPYVLVLLGTGLTAMVGLRILFSLYALALGASALQVGLIAAIYQLFSLAISMPVGMLGDRHGARLPLAIGGVFGGAGILVAYFSESLAGLFLGSALCGVWAATHLVMTQTLVGRLSTPESMTRNFGNFSLVASSAWLVGAPLAGFAIDNLGHALACLAFFVFAASFIVLVLAGGRSLPPGRKKGAGRGFLLALLADRRLWWVLMISGTVQLAADLYPFYLPLHGHKIGLSASSIGVAIAAAHVAAFGVRLAMQALIGRLGEELLLAWGLGVSAAAIAVVPLLTSMPGLVLASLVFGAGIALGHPITSMLMFRNSPPGREGEAMGLRAAGNGVLRVTAPMVFGGIAALTGLPAVFVLTGVLLGSIALLIGRQATRAGA